MALEARERRSARPSCSRPSQNTSRGNQWHEPIVRIADLHKSFGSLEVLKGVDLEVHKGEVVVILGPSGSGKSTMLRCINRLEEPTGGKIFFEDTEITRPQDQHQQDPRAHRHGVPELQPVPASHRQGQRHARPAEGAQALEGRGREPAPSSSSTRSVSATRSTTSRRSSPAASSSASRSRARWRWTRT